VEWELTFVLEGETRQQLTYLEERVVPEASVQRNPSVTGGVSSCLRADCWSVPAATSEAAGDNRGGCRGDSLDALAREDRGPRDLKYDEGFDRRCQQGRSGRTSNAADLGNSSRRGGRCGSAEWDDR